MQVAALEGGVPQSGPVGLEQVFLEHKRRVFRAAYRITGRLEDAEDVLQTVFLRLARRDPVLIEDANLPSYLYRSAINASLDVMRSRRQSPIVDVAHAARMAADDSATAPDHLQHSSEIRGWLRQALARLRPRAAEIFVLRYFEDYDNADIARQLGLSRVAVAVTLHRTRLRLRRELRTMTREIR